ncbi:MAG: DNA replication protein DnaD [Lachnospiraceae bacterium]|nr:DNA replication protein DnaD [Lachnospiraceae bacterium]
MKEYTTGNSKVDAMAQMQLTGNVTPSVWYRTITRENGKPHLLAIAILSDIAYWYRPTEIREEGSGHIIGYKKKFKADLLQRSYDQFAELFGESKRSVTDAVIRLEVLGVIKREFRTIDVAGIKYNNVLFIDFFPERLYELTYPDTADQQNLEHELLQPDPVTKFRERGHENENTLSQNFGRGVTKKSERGHEKTGEGSQNFGRRNTKITTEITTENISSSSSDDDEMIKEYLEITKELYSAEIISSVIEELRKRDSMYLKKISPQIFAEICKNITEHATSNIINASAYIQKCIDNMITGQKLSEANRMHQIRAGDQSTGMVHDYNFEELEQQIISN